MRLAVVVVVVGVTKFNLGNLIDNLVKENH